MTARLEEQVTRAKDDLRSLVSGAALTGQLPEDLEVLLLHHNLPRTLNHCLRVGRLAHQLAEPFEVEQSSARLAGWLHDCSAVIPRAKRLHTAERWGVEVLPEEAAFPLILHQKLSAVLAVGLFGIQDAAVLSAIGCHTTLKAGASNLDKVVFIADKIAWDRPGKPPYLPAVQRGLDLSLDAGVLAYLDHMVQQRAALPGPLHPWLLQAHAELFTKISPV